MRLKMDDYERRWDNDTRRWVYKHRETVETHLGRPLTKDEHIHHINGDVLDNRLGNLSVTTAAEHMSVHKPVYQRVFRPCTNP